MSEYKYQISIRRNRLYYFKIVFIIVQTSVNLPFLVNAILDPERSIV